ncbi:Ig-like domain-containing protein, partial [Zavarzinella formosa]|uniref:Ig-like domain-containing protein n=1 Tax=Zavarzinella formosa TaxID=360055 RepID=UPI00037A9540
NAATVTALVVAQPPGGVTVYDNVIPTGVVRFVVDGQPFGDPQELDATGRASFSTASLSVGDHTVSAVFTDQAGNFLGSGGMLPGTLTIGDRIATTVVATVPSGSFKAGSPITLQATVAPESNRLPVLPNGVVTFRDTTTNTVLGSVPAVNGVATLAYTVSLPPGAHAIVASFAGDANYLADTSDAATLSVLSPTQVTWAADSAADPNQISLREAVAYADSNPGSTLTFLPSLAGQTLTLASPLPALSANMTITGLGSSLLTVTGNGFGSLFVVNAGVTATIRGLTVTGGGTVQGFRVVSGAGIYNAGTLTLANDAVTGNMTTLSGGGIYNIGTLTVLDSSVSNNSAAWGGGIANTGTLDIERTTFSGNTAIGNNGSNGQSITGGGGGGAGLGGALFNFNGGTVTLLDSTISN